MKGPRLFQKFTRVISRCGANAAASARVLQCGGPAKACQRAVGSARLPNIILITLDSLRADRVGAAFHGASLTPNLDALCQESVRFTKAIAQASWTKPSVGSLFTSLYPSVHGANERGAFGAKVDDNTDRARANVIRSGVITLSEALAGAGYRTAAFTGGGFTHALYQGQGFQSFYGHGSGLRDLFYQCARWFASRPPTPFFVWLHAYDTHRPYQGRSPLARFARKRPFNLSNADVKAINSGQLRLSPAQIKHLTTLYDEGVRHADRQVGFLLHALRASGLLDRTVLIFTSDHGEAMYEHGLVEHWDVIYNEVLHVPLLLRIPGVEPQTIGQYVRLIDVMPTVLDLVGVPLPTTQGASLLPILREGVDLGLAAFSELEPWNRPRALQATLDGRDYKAIRWLETGETAFFDLTADPGETVNLAGQDSSPERHIMALLEAQIQENASWAGRLGRDVEGLDMKDTWEIENRLRELGYID